MFFSVVFLLFYHCFEIYIPDSILHLRYMCHSLMVQDKCYLQNTNYVQAKIPLASNKKFLNPWILRVKPQILKNSPQKLDICFIINTIFFSLWNSLGLWQKHLWLRYKKHLMLYLHLINQTYKLKNNSIIQVIVILTYKTRYLYRNFIWWIKAIDQNNLF